MVHWGLDAVSLLAVRISRAQAEVHRWSTSFCLHWYYLWFCRKRVNYWTRLLRTHPSKQDIVKSSALNNSCWHTWPPDGLVFKHHTSMYILNLNIFSHIPVAWVKVTHWPLSCPVCHSCCFCVVPGIYRARTCQTREANGIVWVLCWVRL